MCIKKLVAGVGFEPTTFGLSDLSLGDSEGDGGPLA